MQVLPSPIGVKYSQTVEVKAQNLPEGLGHDRGDDLRPEQRRGPDDRVAGRRRLRRTRTTSAAGW